ncbi:hypothetical protein MF271_00730 (plasmid) [Deinococcus sp. KNUC1210]|uniref:hypothetical protein n=1 Tax=Deinococcus sp. KNUC1210 TaxID=2917691 RepID=UPI001EF13AEE|nr:hypothetical protein [Deinococcus sp. KNUC1210]ULH14037.1 hypothetical protein MF271_00730 [Deinococcus sp. KNUC1210]
MNPTLLSVLALLTPTALATPLLGTTGSFSAGGPCKEARCALSSREPISRTIVDERYTFPPEHPTPNQMQSPGPTISVIRVNNVVTSLGFEAGVQDSIFFQPDYLTRLISRVFTFAAGTSVSPVTLAQLERQCETANGKATLTRVGAFTLACVNSGGEYSNARRVIYRIF